MSSPPIAGRILSWASRAMPSCSAKPLPLSSRHGVSITNGAPGRRPRARGRLYDELVSAAGAWAQPWRGGLKAAVMPAGDPPRVVGTSREAPPPQRLYEALYGARSHGDNDLKAGQHALHRDRPSATSCLANAMRLLLAGAAYGLPQALRPHTRQHPALAQAQPSTVILTLCKMATQRPPYQDRMLLHLPSSCPGQALVHRVTTLLCAVPEPVCNTS